MAEYINRAELIENLNKFAPEHYNALINHLITKQPTADVVEVTRCKNCNNCEILDEDSCYCSYFNKNVDSDGYCSYGG